MNELVKLAIDAHKGNVTKYSVAEANETLRKALIEANGGDTKIDIRAIRDGKCTGVFALVEEIIKNTVQEGIVADPIFDALVDYRNLAEGDAPLFDVEDDTLFYIDKVARGTQAIRRQRLGGVRQVTIPTVVHAVRIYEELDRILAGRADFSAMIDKVAKSEQYAILTEIYDLLASMTSADLGTAYAIPNAGAAAGSYNEATLLEIIEHVEAASGGKTATIFGTKTALRNLMDGITAPAEIAKEDMYNNGYIGKFYGSPVIAIPQRHHIGTTNFIYNDKMITVIASEDKPIKHVTEGDPLIINRDPSLNMDLTQEYFLAEKWGTGIVMNGNAGIGKYVIS